MTSDSLEGPQGVVVGQGGAQSLLRAVADVDVLHAAPPPTHSTIQHSTGVW
jgi:hypothetical protein